MCLPSQVLFERKVALREYDAALEWARTYGMSEDPVRQAQWREGEVTPHSLSSFLACVSSLRWVLQEACTRVPSDPTALSQLLEFGSTRLSTALSGEGDGQGGREEGGGASVGDLTEEEAAEFASRLDRYTSRLRTFLLLNQAEGEASFNPDSFIAFRDADLPEFADELAAQELLPSSLVPTPFPPVSHPILTLILSSPPPVAPSPSLVPSSSHTPISCLHSLPPTQPLTLRPPLLEQSLCLYQSLGLAWVTHKEKGTDRFHACHPG